MSEETKPESTSPATKGDGAKRSMGPFDHPWFLPGLLYAFSIWFGYDGWLNPNIKSVMFNRVMAPLWLAGAIYYTIQNLRDQRRRREAVQPPGTPPQR
jgi:hypothetical protein